MAVTVQACLAEARGELFGAGANNDIVLPRPAPDRAGVFNYGSGACGSISSRASRPRSVAAGFARPCFAPTLWILPTSSLSAT